MVGRLFQDDEEQRDPPEPQAPSVAPLFPPGDGPAQPPAPAREVQVGALDLPDAPLAPPPPSPVAPLSFTGATARQSAGPAEASMAFAIEEDPSVGPAMRHAAEKFPQLVAEQERALRNRFREILPFTFDGIAQYGRSDLERNTAVMAQVTAESQQWSTLALAESLQQLVEDAKPAHGLLGKVLHAAADGQELHRRLDGLTQACQALEQRLDALADEQASVAADFKVHLAVLAVCLSLPSRFADVLKRRAELFSQADQECQLAAKQIETLGKGVREGILRLDEMRNVTLPAMGFLKGA